MCRDYPAIEVIAGVVEAGGKGMEEGGLSPPFFLFLGIAGIVSGPCIEGMVVDGCVVALE